MQVDTKLLRGTLLPLASTPLEDIKGLLVAKARQETQRLLTDLGRRCEALEARPQDLHEFMDFLVW